MMTHQRIPFSFVCEKCRREGVEALATIAVPERLDSGGLELMLVDGLGDMAFIRRQEPTLLEPASFLDGAQAVLVVSLPYQPILDDPGQIKRARYAAGKDYHRVLGRKLSRIGRQLLSPDGNSYGHRVAVDSSPVMERTLARLAGLGWIGRNALLITPGRGSYQFLGFLFTHAPLELRTGEHGANRCGKCNRCEHACPTGAIVDGRVLSERCISYLTIEHKGVIPRDLAGKFEGWWFGCDICQEACPWNRFAPEAGDARLEGFDTEQDLLDLTADAFDDHFAGRAIRRIDYQRFRRNLLTALWSQRRLAECDALLEERPPLVQEQARELGLLR
jgi:epoxyqueuosine reductase